MIQERAILAGGCFWGMEELIRQLPGVIGTMVGDTGGSLPNPTYSDMKSKVTGHAEAVDVIFEPSMLSCRELLDFMFQIHDPAAKNRPGNEIGPSYRPAIFYINDAQKQETEQLIAEMSASQKWLGTIVTEIVPAGIFRPAEDHHQVYLRRNPNGYACHYIRRGWRL
jgi:peptide-methionine (S)-S-oxide reductase